MSCKLYLDNYGTSYTVGEEIVGRVECYFSETIPLRSIKVRISCKEHNKWTDTESYYDSSSKRHKTRHVTCTGDNTLLFKEEILYGSASGEHRLSPGHHTYHFKFVLPTSLPSSFEGPYGFVKYKVKAIVDRPWRFDIEDYCSLTVKAPLYIDRFPSDELTQTTFEDDKSVCCLCCKGGIISMVVTMPRMVFVPGERINVPVKLTNLSNTNVNQLKIKLQKTVTFKVTSPSHRTRTSDEDIVNVRDHGVGAHGEYTYNLSIPIPDYIEVPNFTNCHLFEVHYLFQVEACLDGCSTNLEINTYISLAHISSERWANTTMTPLPPIGFSAVPPSVSDYPSAPPLSSSATDDINPPPYTSLIPEKGVYPGGPPTAPTSPASAPPLTLSTSNSVAAGSSLETPPPAYSDTLKSSSP